MEVALPEWDQLYGVPPDPIYLAFRDGVLRANDDLTDAWRWRWSPRNNGWFTYAVAQWVLDDVAVADTSAGFAFDIIRDDDPDVERARSASVLPDLFRRVQAAYSVHRARWPNLVWSLHGGGDWRNAMSRHGSPSGPTVDPDVDSASSLPLECKKRIADVRAYAARGDITSAQAQRLIAKIVEECTLRPE